jgi:hypothetical protein
MKLSDARPLNSCKLYIEDFVSHESTPCTTCQNEPIKEQEPPKRTKEYETILQNCHDEYQDDIQGIHSILESVGVVQRDEVCLKSDSNL